MRFAELIVLLPCHSLEDFPLYYEGDDADGLLASWTGLWHPLLIHSAQSVPTWSRVDAPPYTLADRLLVVPSVCVDRLPADFPDRVKTDGGLLISKFVDRNDLMAQALSQLDGAVDVDPELVADFLALGFCRLQTELLTRQMRYSSNLDEGHFQREAVAAAEAAVQRDGEVARSHLRQCFDALDEARKYFYPVESYLIDLLLVAETTLGGPLAGELQTDLPTNLLLSGDLAQKMASEHPATLEALRTALDAGSATIVGGEQHEGPLPLWPLEEMREELARGLATYQQQLGRRPTVYGRRRYGLSPMLPQLLSKMGFQSAVHITLDDGHFPLDSQAKSRWESGDGSAIDALMKLPRDAAKAESFVDFSRRMGESMDRDHVATLLFAHWPGQFSPWYGDLRRACSYTSALGKFITLDEYFTQTNLPGRLSRFSPDDYRAPYLKQAIIRRQADPLSIIQRTHQESWRQYLCAAAGTIGALASGHQLPKASADGDCTAAVCRSLAKSLSSENSDTRSCLVLNPLSFARRITVDVSDLNSLPDLAGAVAAATAQADGNKHAAVDVPAFGFVWLEPGRGKSSRKTPKPIAEANVLRNDVMEVVISTTSGGIQSIRDFRHRGNRLSQQLALREPSPLPKPGEIWRDPDTDPSYSVAVCESLEVTSASTVLGEITTRGAVMDLEGKRLADFRQTTQLGFGSRIVRVEVELNPHEELRADPWNSYYCARFAWNDAAAELYRGVALCRHETKAKRIEAPEYIDIQSEKQRTSILTGGLPYHRRVGMRMLDSLLLVRGETARSFTFGVAVDVPNPAAAAVELLTPTMVTMVERRPVSSTGWLLHVDARNVLATHLEPVIIESGACTGFRMRLLETQGRAGKVRLTSARPLSGARQLDLLGQPLLPLAVEEDKIVMDVAAHEWVYLEASFA